MMNSIDVRQTKIMIRRVIDSLAAISRKTFYSQLGEDAVLQAYFGGILGVHNRWNSIFNRTVLTPGFYVDIGAYSPKRISNTYWLYRQGWSGITIEPNPLVATDFKKFRPRDQHLTMAVSPNPGTVYYYTSGYGATSYIRTEREEPEQGFKVMEVQSKPLVSILADSSPPRPFIYYLLIVKDMISKCCNLMTGPGSAHGW